MKKINDIYKNGKDFLIIKSIFYYDINENFNFNGNFNFIENLKNNYGIGFKYKNFVDRNNTNVYSFYLDNKMSLVFDFKFNVENKYIIRFGLDKYDYYPYPFINVQYTFDESSI